MQEPSPYTYTNSKSKRYFCWRRCRLNVIFDLEMVLNHKKEVLYDRKNNYSIRQDG